jgi:hypothetical protein
LDHTHYFKRTTVYKIEDSTVSLVDVHDNNTITPLDPWMGAVIALADGQHSVAQLVQHMAGQYPEGAPDNLAATIESVIKRLTDSGVLALTPAPVTLPYYLNMPLDAQEPKLATELMINDGFLRPAGAP